MYSLNPDLNCCVVHCRRIWDRFPFVRSWTQSPTTELYKPLWDTQSGTKPVFYGEIFTLYQRYFDGERAGIEAWRCSRAQVTFEVLAQTLAIENLTSLSLANVCRDTALGNTVLTRRMTGKLFIGSARPKAYIPAYISITLSTPTEEIREPSVKLRCICMPG